MCMSAAVQWVTISIYQTNKGYANCTEENSEKHILQIIFLTYNCQVHLQSQYS